VAAQANFELTAAEVKTHLGEWFENYAVSHFSFQSDPHHET
jgi:hypothetical protein